MSKSSGSGGRLDPEALARRLAEQLRSSRPDPPKPPGLHRRELAAGLLRFLGIGSIVVGISLALMSALPWAAGLFGSEDPVDDLPPSFSRQVPAIPPQVAPVVITTGPTNVTASTTATTRPATTTISPQPHPPDD